MQQKLTYTRSGNSRLILIFAGWSTDATLYPAPDTEGYDLMVVWDYTDTSIDITPLTEYREIVVIGYSFGVAAASWFLNNYTQLPVTARIAVNGTCHPVDDTRGIPRAIFDGTLAGLSERNLTKFHRRMAGSRETYESIATRLPSSPCIEALKTELEAIDHRGCINALWDMAWVSDSDLIIPPQNQEKAWNEAGVTIKRLSGPHFPDFKAIFSTVLTDKGLVARQFARAAGTYDTAATIQRRIATTLVNLWAPAPDMHPDLLEIGCGTGMSTRIILERITPRHLRLWDLSPVSSTLPGADEIKACDGETAIARLAPGSIDVIFSSSTIQWFNSARMFLQRCVSILRPGGKLVLSTFGPATFARLHEITGITTTYPTPETLKAIVPDEFSITTLESEEIEVEFDSMSDMMHHISATGVNAMRQEGSIAATRRIMQQYPLSADGKPTIVYQPIYLILTKKQ